MLQPYLRKWRGLNALCYHLVKIVTKRKRVARAKWVMVKGIKTSTWAISRRGISVKYVVDSKAQVSILKVIARAECYGSPAAYIAGIIFIFDGAQLD